ncbi:MAG: DUF3426 domain-containing protein [Desulfobacterales bacterium]|nr:DUF3426 domain-containing protein [Desulfobacterales bacterium]MDD4072964.1 DUF3426 domain-containing protein [Desulfobacterales bacterium]MDD4392273.1 DUF3426 domain-containing protein [Desulfobacterales bacterium]
MQTSPAPDEVSMQSGFVSEFGPEEKSGGAEVTAGDLGFELDEAAPEGPAGPETPEDDLELELDFDLGEEQGPSTEVLAKTGEPELSDLDLDLELDEAAPEEPAGPETPEGDLELELDFDLGEEQEGPSTEVLAKTGEPELSDLDLDLDLDLELDEAAPEEPAGPETPEDDLKLELDEPVDDLELNFDIEGFAKDTDQTDQMDELKAQTLSGTEDTNLAFEMESQDKFDMGVIGSASEDHSAAFGVEGDRNFEEMIRDNPENSDAQEEEKPESGIFLPPRQKRVGTPVIILLIVVLLGAGVYGGWTMLEKSGINVPFISDFFKPDVPDAGNLKMSTVNIASKFLENSKSGRIFVITGEAKNEYPGPVGLIRITGKLFTKGKVIAKSQTVYCGNVLSDLDLSNLEVDVIQNRLSNRFGDNRSNVKLEPGSLIPFMIVFPELPENLDEFSVEVQESVPYKG